MSLHELNKLMVVVHKFDGLNAKKMRIITQFFIFPKYAITITEYANSYWIPTTLNYLIHIYLPASFNLWNACNEMIYGH